MLPSGKYGNASLLSLMGLREHQAHALVLL